jgi:hypothetical protein
MIKPTEKLRTNEKSETKKFAKLASLFPAISSIASRRNTPEQTRVEAPTPLKTTTITKLNQFFTTSREKVGQRIQEIKQDYASLKSSNNQPQPMSQYKNWDGSRGQVPIPPLNRPTIENSAPTQEGQPATILTPIPEQASSDNDSAVNNNPQRHLGPIPKIDHQAVSSLKRIEQSANNSTSIGSTPLQTAESFIYNNGSQKGINELNTVISQNTDPHLTLAALEKHIETIRLPYRSAFDNISPDSYLHGKTSTDLAAIQDHYNNLKTQLVKDIQTADKIYYNQSIDNLLAQQTADEGNPDKHPTRMAKPNQMLLELERRESLKNTLKGITNQLDINPNVREAASQHLGQSDKFDNPLYEPVLNSTNQAAIDYNYNIIKQLKLHANPDEETQSRIDEAIERIKGLRQENKNS